MTFDCTHREGPLCARCRFDRDTPDGVWTRETMDAMIELIEAAEADAVEYAYPSIREAASRARREAFEEGHLNALRHIAVLVKNCIDAAEGWKDG